jgi:hypothetical protein
MATTEADDSLRELLSSLICQFCLAVTREDASASAQLQANIMQGHPLITRGECR